MAVATAADFETYRRQTDESRQAVETALEALNKGDAEGFLGAFSDDVHFEMPGSTPVSGEAHGLEEFVAVVSNVARYLSEAITLKITFFLAAGEWVVTRADGHGVANSGKDYDNRYCLLWRVRDGKVVEFTEFNDTKLIMDVLCSPDNPPVSS